jgi:hypothetical protein
MIQGDLQDAGTAGEGAAASAKAPAPPANIPKGGGGGKGAGTDPMEGMDLALDKADNQMEKLNAEFGKLGNEASMAAKEGGLSFDQLRDKATTDYQDMQAKYKQFEEAVDSGSKDAAKQAENAWHEAAQKFQTDWEQAKQKATQDMHRSRARPTRWPAKCLACSTTRSAAN